MVAAWRHCKALGPDAVCSMAQTVMQQGNTGGVEWLLQLPGGWLVSPSNLACLLFDALEYDQPDAVGKLCKLQAANRLDADIVAGLMCSADEIGCRACKKHISSLWS